MSAPTDLPGGPTATRTRSMVRVGVVQAAPVWLDRDATVEKACSYIAEAGRVGVDVLAFGENFIPGHPVWYHFHPADGPESIAWAIRLFQSAVEISGEAVRALCDAAARASINVVVGITERQPASTATLYNTQLFIDSLGRVAGKHQKLVPTMTERLVHAPGRPEFQGVFPSEFGPISSLVCGENSNPLALAFLAALYPRIHVASWPEHVAPTSIGSVRENSLLVSRANARMLGSFVLSACGVNSPEMVAEVARTEADLEFLEDPTRSGGSSIINPAGQVIAGPLSADEEGLLTVVVDLDACLRARHVHDVAGHYSRPDVFQLVAKTRPTPLILDDIPARDNGPERSVLECEQTGSAPQAEA